MIWVIKMKRNKIPLNLDLGTPTPKTRNKSSKTIPDKSMIGKILVRTAPHPTTGCRSFLGEKLKLLKLSDKLYRFQGVSPGFYNDKEVLLSAHPSEYGDGEWELY